MNKAISFFSLPSLLFLVLLTNGCREDFPDPVEGEARFWLSADFVQGGKLEAGKADYELFPSYEIGDLGWVNTGRTYAPWVVKTAQGSSG